VFTLLNKADAALEALSRGSCGPRAGLPGSRAIRETDVQLFLNHRRNPDGDRCFILGPVNKIRLFFRVPEMVARAARGARSAPEGRRKAPRSGAGCRAAAQSAAAGG